MTAISGTGTSRPFDVDRDGFVMGEGAAVFVLEEWEAAHARGATILGEVLGGASNADAHHITAPSPGRRGRDHVHQAGARRRRARTAATSSRSTPTARARRSTTAAEAAAITAVFGPDGPPVVSTKGVTGHALGAAGALEAAAVVLSIQHRLIPPTANTKVIDDDDADRRRDRARARPWEPGPALSNNFGFGGHNGSIIIGPG